MKFFSTLTAIAALATSALAQLTVNTPAAVIQCQPVQLTFSGGTAPYFLAIIPGGQVSATPLRDFGQVSSSPYTWTANIAAGTSITLRLSDQSGQFVYSSPISIQAGSSDACLSSTAVTGATTVASTPSSSGAASAATTTGGFTSTVSGTVTSAASVTTTFSSSSAASSSTTSAVASSVSSRVSSVSNALSSAISSVVSQAASATSTGAAMPTGVAGAGAVFVGALGAMVALF